MQTAYDSLLASFATTVQLPWEAGVKLPAVWRLALPGVVGDDSMIVWTWSLLWGCSSSVYKRKNLKLSKSGWQHDGRQYWRQKSRREFRLEAGEKGYF